MHVASQIQEALHRCGIHSTTIQPEYPTPGTAIVRKVRLGSFMVLAGLNNADVESYVACICNT